MISSARPAFVAIIDTAVQHLRATGTISMRLLILILGFLALAIPSPASADLEEDLQAIRAEAMAIPGAVVTEFPDFTMVVEQSGLTMHYFTKLSHYAHPSAIRREAVESNGTWFIVYATWPYEMETSPESFKRWMDEFAVLDQALFEFLTQERVD